MSLRLTKPLTDRDAGMLNALQLAYLGDSVWETVVRDTLVHRGLNVHHMHRSCVEYVNAAAQASFLEMILPETDEREQEIIRRGRNAHARHPAPKNQELGDYSAATGFEALIGFLYITGREDRILQFAGMIIGGNGDG